MLLSDAFVCFFYMCCYVVFVIVATCCYLLFPPCVFMICLAFFLLLDVVACCCLLLLLLKNIRICIMFDYLPGARFSQQLILVALWIVLSGKNCEKKKGRCKFAGPLGPGRVR